MNVNLDDLVAYGEAMAKTEMEDSVKRANELYAKRLATLPSRLVIVLKLIEAGIIQPDEWAMKTADSLNRWYIRQVQSSYEAVIVDPALLPALHSIFGQCKVTDEYDIHDAEQNLIKVRLDIEKADIWEHRFYITRELPADAKCRIVTEKRVSSNTYLACDRE